MFCELLLQRNTYISKRHSRKQKPTKIEKIFRRSILKKLKSFFTYRSEMGVQEGRNLQKKRKIEG
jgi:hypothetical protein